MIARLMAALALLCACALPAHAHKASDSYLVLRVNGRAIEGQWDIALRDLDAAIGLDADGNGELTWDEVRHRHQAIAAYALARLTLASGDAPCPLTAGADHAARPSSRPRTPSRPELCPTRSAAAVRRSISPTGAPSPIRAASVASGSANRPRVACVR